MIEKLNGLLGAIADFTSDTSNAAAFDKFQENVIIGKFEHLGIDRKLEGGELADRLFKLSEGELLPVIAYIDSKLETLPDLDLVELYLMDYFIDYISMDRTKDLRINLLGKNFRFGANGIYCTFNNLNKLYDAVTSCEVK
jgi:hypothetical protein